MQFAAIKSNFVSGILLLSVFSFPVSTFHLCPFLHLLFLLLLLLDEPFLLFNIFCFALEICFFALLIFHFLTAKAISLHVLELFHLITNSASFVTLLLELFHPITNNASFVTFLPIA